MTDLKDLRAKAEKVAGYGSLSVEVDIPVIIELLDQIEKAETALREIESFDENPQNHNPNAMYCGICVAREYFNEVAK